MEITISIDWIDESGGVITNEAAKRFNVILIPDDSEEHAEVTGTKENILALLTSDLYDLNRDEALEIYPELF